MNDEVEIQWPNWHCDGEDCTVKGSLWKVEKHIVEEFTLPDGSMKPLLDIHHWGAVADGSPASMVRH